MKHKIPASPKTMPIEYGVRHDEPCKAYTDRCRTARALMAFYDQNLALLPRQFFGKEYRESIYWKITDMLPNVFEKIKNLMQKDMMAALLKVLRTK